MYKLFAILTVALVLFTTAACQPLSIDEAQVAYCQDLKAYGQAVHDLRNMPESATVDDLEAQAKVVEDAYRQLENSAWDLADSQNEALRPAYNEMRAGLDTITKDTPVVEARTIISDSVSTYMDTYNEVVRFSCATVQPTATP
ncbi:MAG TPA: conotoxin [Caldilineaceae bacterium]|nr:conotoxin [Caldilineaceae bacterium]